MKKEGNKEIYELICPKCGNIDNYVIDNFHSATHNVGRLYHIIGKNWNVIVDSTIIHQDSYENLLKRIKRLQ